MVSGAFGLPYGDAPAGRPPVRWGLPDFVLVWIGGIVVSAVTSAVALAVVGGEIDGAAVTAAAVFGQFGGWVAGCWVVARVKGRSPTGDLGLRLAPGDLWAVPAGIAVFVCSSLAIAPIVRMVGESQAVVDELEQAGGAKLVVFALTAAIIAPFAEELVFRGLLLRALQRRTTVVAAIVIQALVFALVHPLLSPTLGDLAVVPALFGLGVLCGAVAARRRDISAAVFLHIGFNLVTVVLAVTGS
ncbi:MAG: lysostaphin resistance A-like protein [Actinomycetota bacterium]